LTEENESFKAEKREARVKKILADWKARGREFADDKAEKAEIEKLMKKTDDALTDMEEMLLTIPVKAEAEDAEAGADNDDLPDDAAEAETPPKAEASVQATKQKAVATRLDDVPDSKSGAKSEAEQKLDAYKRQSNTI